MPSCVSTARDGVGLDEPQDGKGHKIQPGVAEYCEMHQTWRRIFQEILLNESCFNQVPNSLLALEIYSTYLEYSRSFHFSEPLQWLRL